MQVDWTHRTKIPWLLVQMLKLITQVITLIWPDHIYIFIIFAFPCSFSLCTSLKYAHYRILTWILLMFDFDWETLVKLEYALHVCVYCMCISKASQCKNCTTSAGENKRVSPYLMVSCSSVQRLKVRPFWLRPKYAHLPPPLVIDSQLDVYIVGVLCKVDNEVNSDLKSFYCLIKVICEAHAFHNTYRVSPLCVCVCLCVCIIGQRARAQRLSKVGKKRETEIYKYSSVCVCVHDVTCDSLSCVCPVTFFLASHTGTLPLYVTHFQQNWEWECNVQVCVCVRRTCIQLALPFLFLTHSVTAQKGREYSKHTHTVTCMQMQMTCNAPQMALFELLTHVYATSTLTLTEKERGARARIAAALVAFHNQMPSNSSSRGKCSCSSAATERKATAEQHSARVGTCFSNGCNTSKDHCELVLSAPSSDDGGVRQQQQLLGGSKKEGEI